MACNTGWTVPIRSWRALPYSRNKKIVRSVQSGLMANAPMEKDPIFDHKFFVMELTQMFYFQ